MNKKAFHFLLPLLFVCLYINACDTNSSTAKPEPRISVHDLLQKSVQVMQKEPAFHFSVRRYIETTTYGKPTTYTVSSVDFTGDEKGDQLKTTLTSQLSQPQGDLKSAGNDYHQQPLKQYSSVLTQGTVYFLTSNQGWLSYSEDKSTLYGPRFLPDTQANVLNVILKTVRDKGQNQDKGIEALGSQALRHIHTTLDKSTYEKFLVQSQRADFTHLDNNKQHPFSASYDLWIDEGTGYLYKMTEKWNLTSASDNPAVTAQITENGEETALLTNFQEQVQITAPDKSTPAKDPNEIL